MTASADPTSPPGALHALALPAILSLAVVQVTASVDRAVPSVLALRIKAEFGLSDVQPGALQGAAFSTLYAVGRLAATLNIGASPAAAARRVECARGEAAVRHIVAHLADRDIDADSIAVATGQPRSALYRFSSARAGWPNM